MPEIDQVAQEKRLRRLRMRVRILDAMRTILQSECHIVVDAGQKMIGIKTTMYDESQQIIWLPTEWRE